MDKLILDFEGDKVEIPAGFSTERALSVPGTIVMHNGNSYEVRGRIVLGVDEVASEYASWDRDSDRKEQLTLILKLVRVG